jgi:arsenate reductase-like glutaredoxin family protein
MKADQLESFVQENRQEFDQFEPSEQSWEMISKRLEAKKDRSVKTLNWLRIAVAIAVIAVIPAIIYQLRLHESTQVAKIDPEVQELLEAEKYYSQEVSGKLAEIQKCYKIYPELKGEVEDDLNELENMYKSLKSDLKDNVSNKEVIEAMIENNRYRLKLVDEVLEQINC